MKNQILISASFILLFVCNLFNTQSANAQDEFGLKGGIIYSNIYKSGPESNVNFEFKDGLSVGVFYKRNLSEKFGFQSEILYQQKGAEVTIEPIEGSLGSGYSPYSGEVNSASVSIPYSTKEKLHYLSLPLLVSFKPANFIELFAGPELNYLFSMNSDRLKTNNLNRFSPGISAGARLKLGNNTALDFRYSFDLNHYDNMGDSNYPAKLKTNSFAITLQQSLLFRKQK